jgi:transposase-like protein
MIPIEHLCCQNSQCADAGIRDHGNLTFRGWSGKSRRIRMVHRRTCKSCFSERKGTAWEQARLPDDKVLAIFKHIREGCGTRATSRPLDGDKNTVTRYLAVAGAHGEQLHDELVAFSPSNP